MAKDNFDLVVLNKDGDGPSMVAELKEVAALRLVDLRIDNAPLGTGVPDNEAATI